MTALPAAIARIEAAIAESVRTAAPSDFAHAKVLISDLRLVLAELERRKG